jgi:putative chitinase
VEFYHDLNNNLINAWLFEKKTKKLMVLNKVVTDINNPQSLSTTKVQGGGCITVQVKSYVSFSEITPPGDGQSLPGVAVGWYVSNLYFQICGGGGSPGGGGGSPAPGPGGGPSILPGSSADTTWPSKKQEPPEQKKNPCPINLDQLKKAIPGNVNQQETLKKLIGLLDKWGPQFGFDNEYKVRHFLAQMAKETGGLNTLAPRESLDYRESTLLRIWPNMFSTNPSQWNGAGCYNPKEFAHNEEKVANVIWPFRNGNHQPGDGWKFRGRGVLQLNGRGNYTEFRDFYNKLFPANKLDFVEYPDLVNSTDEIAVLSGMWWCKRYLWKEFKWNENTSVDQVSGMVNKFKKNAKAVGLDDRRKYFQDINKFVDCD